MKITILDDYQYSIEQLACFDLLKGLDVEIIHHTEADPVKLAAAIQDTEILVLTRERTKISEQLLAELPKLKLISQTGKIANHLDLAACTSHGVAVAEGIGSPTAPAELTWALLMNTVRKIPAAIDGMKQGHWQVNLGECIAGKTIGIWGYGKIGQQIAKYAHAFGAKVLVWGSESSRQKAVEHGFMEAPTKEAFFRNADIITVHLRLNDSTRGIIQESDLMRMKDGACFINTARAELVAAKAITHVLQTDKDLRFGLDVYEEEPILDPNFALLHDERVVCTPHIGYVEKNSYELYFRVAFENVLRFLEGNPTNIANPSSFRSTY